MGKSVLEFAADLGSQHKSGQIFQVALFHLPGICYFSSVITGPKVEPDVDHSAFPRTALVSPWRAEHLLAHILARDGTTLVSGRGLTTGFFFNDPDPRAWR